MTMHRKMAETMDTVIEEIKAIQKHARETGDAERPKWPMIVLRTPKGWTGPKVVDGQKIEGSFRASSGADLHGKSGRTLKTVKRLVKKLPSRRTV